MPSGRLTARGCNGGRTSPGVSSHRRSRSGGSRQFVRTATRMQSRIREVKRAERDPSVATDEPCNSPALTVTFDTNTLASVVWPENPQCENVEAAITVQAAVQDGRIRGFFSETVITLEGVMNCDRSEILGKTRVMVDVTASGENHPGG